MTDKRTLRPWHQGSGVDVPRPKMATDTEWAMFQAARGKTLSSTARKFGVTPVRIGQAVRSVLKKHKLYGPADPTSQLPRIEDDLWTNESNENGDGLVDPTTPID